jgi:uncharacterized protein
MDDLAGNKAIATRFMQALSALDGATVASLITPDFTIHTKGSSVLSGETTLANMAALTEKLATTLPDGVELTILDTIAEGDRVVVEATGKSVSASGKPYNNEYAMILRIENGRIRSISEYMDTLLVNHVFG